MYTRENLEDINKAEGFPALREIGRSLGVKSRGSDAIIIKILEAQNDVPEPLPSDQEVKIVGLEGLFDRKRNMEVPIDEQGAYFPPLVLEDKKEEIKAALLQFAGQWSFEKIEFFAKLQAFRLYRKGVHMDWIGLNEIIRRYKIKTPLAAKTIAKRLYTAPSKRAYK